MLSTPPEAALKRQMDATPALALLIGTRTYPTLAPSSASLPFVTWRRVGVARVQTLQSPSGLSKVTVEYSIFGATYESCREVADALRLTLDGYGGTVLNCNVSQVSLENENDDFVTLAGADLPPAYQITQQYDVTWQE
jgi:hypothetical protein